MPSVNVMNVLNDSFAPLANMIQTLLDENERLETENKELKAEVQRLKNHIKDLESHIQHLEKQLKTNSSNSSVPPSARKTDPKKTPKKTKSLRGNSGKKPGAQPGHEGKTLEFSHKPDEVVICGAAVCRDCGTALDPSAGTVVSKGQVFDVPEPKMKVVEYAVTQQACPKCGAKNKGELPNGVRPTPQYGATITAIVAYLCHFQLIPFKRLGQLTADLFGRTVSNGTLRSMIARMSDALEPAEALIKKRLLESPVIHLDETGCYVEKERWWEHVTSNGSYTYYHIHPKRGSAALDEIGILPNYTGTAIHDNWASYFMYDCLHGVCNVHHLREFNAMEEFHRQKWVKEMAALLLEAKSFSESNPYPLPASSLAGFESRFSEILAKGWEENPKPAGKDKNTEPQRLLNRFAKRKTEILQFLYQEEVPFDNNQAERDVRMTKVKQKISGTFRTEDGANEFARIRGVMSTLQKQGFDILKELTHMYSGGEISFA